MWIYSKYITTKKGVRIYPKEASCFRFWVDDEKTDTNLTGKKDGPPKLDP